MATSGLSRVVDFLRAFPRDGGLTDGELLRCFIEHHDEAAFAAIVRRHGPLVLGVCRRVLGHIHDAEEAFQATFLVLVRRAPSLARHDLLGNWLYGVAYRTALEARGRNLRRQRHEKQVGTLPETPVAPSRPDSELGGLLDQELSRLPEKYREPVVLCDLQGGSRAEVARRLGVPEGTLSSRLATARKMLADRLSRRGALLGGIALGALAPPALPPSLVSLTASAATAVATGHASADVVSPFVSTLLKGVLQEMVMHRIKTLSLFGLVVALASTGVGLLSHQAMADRPQQPALVAPEAQPDQPGARQKEKGAQEKGQGRDKEKGGKAAAKGEAINLTGTVEKRQEQRPTDGGGMRTVTLYYLIEENGNKVQLPPPRRNEAGKQLDPINLDEFVSKKVTLAGRGVLARKGEQPNAPRRVIRILSITQITVRK